MGLSDTSIFVNEGEGVVEVCLRVSRPNVDCPVMFEFRVVLRTTPDTAGRMCMSDSTEVQTLCTLAIANILPSITCGCTVGKIRPLFSRCFTSYIFREIERYHAPYPAHDNITCLTMPLLGGFLGC